MAVEPGEARRAPQREHQHARRQRVERAEVPDLAESHQSAHGFDYVVRRFALRLVDHENPVDRRGFGRSWHFQ